MSNTDKETTFEEQIRNALDEQLAQIDSATQAHLQQARQKAVASADKNRHRQWWLPAMAIAATFIISITLIFLKPQTESSAPLLLAQTDYTEDIEILSAKAEFEFYEGLEFLLWLDTADQES